MNGLVDAALVGAPPAEVVGAAPLVVDVDLEPELLHAPAMVANDAKSTSAAQMVRCL
ncbi:MAG TPA: hypothetical protein VFA84_12225 [Acidimicrobiales bacterium]|nr:hypothetical protein [Acidimicrobiales bacterium]